jgi:hypothetical protein
MKKNEKKAPKKLKRRPSLITQIKKKLGKKYTPPSKVKFEDSINDKRLKNLREFLLNE